MTKSIILAVILTLAAAYYQRKTGPTYAVTGSIERMGISIEYELKRSHGGTSDQPVEITIPDTSFSATLLFRRFNSNAAWSGMQILRDGEKLSAALPNQPPAGKLEYYILVQKENKIFTIPPQETVVTRFKGDVPRAILYPHVILMFIAMLMSNAAGFEAIFKGQKMYTFTIWATGLLFIGGMILGPVVQKFAFDAYWTGVPFGMDLTDNKTLIAMIAWLSALAFGRREKSGRWWIIAAAIVLLLVYSIPHSMFGSELNYQTMQVEVSND